MTYVKYKTKDYAEGQLLAGIWTGAVSCVLNAWQGAKFPSLTAWEYFIWTLEQRTGTTVTAKERVLVSARSTDTLTFTRSFGGDTAIAFSANDYFCLHCNSDIIIDIQDEVALKLARNWQLRTGNGTRKIVYNDWSGNETELALGASWSYLKSNGASSAPSFATPPLDINWQSTITPAVGDYVPFYDISGTVNGKCTIQSIYDLLEATNAQAHTGTDTNTIVNPSQLRSFYWGIPTAWTSVLIASYPTEVYQTNTTYVQKFIWTIHRTWTYTISFDMRWLNWWSWWTAYAKIYKNWSAFWTEQSTTSTTDVNKTENLAFTAWDTISLWLKAWFAWWTDVAYVNDFLVRCDQLQFTLS